jgi:hypothetical protein|tara:strand:+ start:1588 stop:1716 length:129 start_codon:yes stop_codon:yes gene_type:complete
MAWAVEGHKLIILYLGQGVLVEARSLGKDKARFSRKMYQLMD